MQQISAALTARLLTIDARVNPRQLIDVVELYDYDYVPGPTGFDPANAVETFAPETITHNGIAYRREVISRSDVVRSATEKTNQVTVTFSNISRYLATLAQTQTIEGLFLVIRTIDPTVTDSSLVLFVGKCDKPSDIDKEQFSLSARQDLGNINQTFPPRKFTAQDPEGRLPSDPLYEGINFIAQTGSVTYPIVVPSNSFFGRLFGRRDTRYVTQQSSSVDGTPYGEPLPEVFGRCQMALIPFLWRDHGLHIGFLMAACNGPISAMENVKVRTPGWSELFNSFNVPPAPPVVHLGLAGTANVLPTNFPGAGYLSHLAYLDANSTGSTFDAIDNPPEITAIIRGRVIPLPNSSGVYSLTGWSDNPIHILRFLLTRPDFTNINPAFMEDAAFVREATHCDEPLIDESTDQLIRVLAANASEDSVARYQSTGLYSPEYFSYYSFGGSDAPELIEVPIDDWIPIDYDNPFQVVYQRVLRKRYTFNAPITAEVKGLDFIYKTLNVSAKILIRVNQYGRIEPVCEKPSDATYTRSATSVSATTIPVLDVTPWKTGPYLLTGRILFGFGLTTSEVRTVSSAAYSADGNSITLAASATGTITATASGANLSGGSATVQASGTITIGGTATAGNKITATINGHPVEYTLTETDTVNTSAAMLAHYINGTPRLAKYIRTEWASGTPTIITIKALYGVLTLSSQLLKPHNGPVADPMVAPTIAASAGTLAAGVYKVAYANVGALGQTGLTPVSSVTLTVNQKIDVSALPAFPAGITSRNFYMSEQANSSNLRYVTNRVNAADFSITALPLPGASLPPQFNATSEELIRVAMSFSTNSQDVIPEWQPNQVVILTDLRLPTVPNGHKYEVTTAGTTGTTEPTWPTTPGGTVVSGSVTFTEIGTTYLEQAGLTRGNIAAKTYRFPLGSRQPSINQIKINYRSAKDDFALIPYRVNDPIRQAQVKKAYPLDVDGSGIDSFHQMFRIANWQLAKHCEGDWFNTFTTGPQGLVLEEGDVICASDDAGGLVNVPTRIEEIRIHSDHTVTIAQARKYSTNMFSDDVGADPVPIASTLRLEGTANSRVEFIDTPPIRDIDSQVPGFYVAVSRLLNATGDWRGWSLYVDFGDGYTYLTEGDLAALIGTTTESLNTVSDTSVYDTTSNVTFTLQYGTRSTVFSSTTQADLIANPNKNLFLIGSEYVQAATITNNGADSFTLTNFYRGRFGTELKTVHSVGERVVYMDGSEVFIPMDGSRARIAYNYKPVTVNQDVADATAVSFTWSGGTYRSPAPTGIVVYRDAYSSGSTSAGQVQIVIPSRLRGPSKVLKYAVDVYPASATGTFTVSDITDIFTATAHGLTSTDTIALSTTGTLPAPLRKEDHYYLRDITANTFKLSRISNGAAINITDTGSGTHSFTRRLRSMPVISGMMNPVVVDNFDATVTTPGSSGWLQTITSAYYERNAFRGVTPANEGLRAFGNIGESGFVVEFSLSTILREVAAQVFTVSLANPANAAASTNAYYQMEFTLITSALGPKYSSASRRWLMTIREDADGTSPPVVFTETDYEMPDTRYSIQISGSEVRYYRNHTGPGSEPIYVSPIPVQFPLALDASVTTKAQFLNVTTGGRPDFITTYSSKQMIKDTGLTPPPTTFRYRAYEHRVFNGFTFLGDVTDFTT